MKTIPSAFVPVVALLMLTGCATRLTDFTVISSKNVELSRMGDYERVSTKLKAMCWWIRSGNNDAVWQGSVTQEQRKGKG